MQVMHCAGHRSAYKEETRTTILALDRVSKTASSGKQILSNIGIGMYKGAKIGECFGYIHTRHEHLHTTCFNPPSVGGGRALG